MKQLLITILLLLTDVAAFSETSVDPYLRPIIKTTMTIERQGENVQSISTITFEGERVKIAYESMVVNIVAVCTGNNGKISTLVVVEGLKNIRPEGRYLLDQNHETIINFHPEYVYKESLKLKLTLGEVIHDDRPTHC